REQAAKADAAQITRLFDLVHDAIRDLSFAARPRLALEVALLSAVHLAPAQSISDLARRLEEVARGAAVAAPQAAPTVRSAPPPRGRASCGAASEGAGGGALGRGPVARGGGARPGTGAAQPSRRAEARRCGRRRRAPPPARARGCAGGLVTTMAGGILAAGRRAASAGRRGRPPGLCRAPRAGLPPRAVAGRMCGRRLRRGRRSLRAPRGAVGELSREHPPDASCAPSSARGG